METRFMISICICAWLTKLSLGKPATDCKTGYDKIALYGVKEELKAKNIEESLRYFSAYPHHPGSERNKELSEHVRKQWEKSGFDKTEVFRYNILLSFPKHPGEISLLNGGEIMKTLVIDNEPVLDETEAKGTPLYPFHAFSPNGSVTGEYVYVNYARESDFKRVRELGIDIKGKIVIARYGKGYRGYKVVRAERRGAIGVIIYSDPADHTIPGKEYPDGWMLNRYGVQRGTINRLTGDALSLGYPSKPNYYRDDISKYSGQPKIPSQPISYSTAYEILGSMRDDSVSLPQDFQGGLNFTYKLSSGRGHTLTLKVFTELQTKESRTVCTTLYGREEPDRYVMLGNHRDSWTYGSSDASSGTAVMMEIVRSYGKMKQKTGWRPRRSIMACSWGAEEAGILDSTEWADENHKFISNHVVSYLNVDMAVEGNFTVRLKALDIVRDGIFETAKTIDSPDDPSKSLYTDWLEKSRILRGDKDMSSPYISPISSGSDYKSFWHTYGTTVVDYRYLFSKKDYPMLGANGHYHTRYESFGWMKKHVDPDFIYHLTIAKLWAGHSLMVADSSFVPFDLVLYTKQITYYLNQFEKAYDTVLKSRDISLKLAYVRLDALHEKTKQFQTHVSKLNVGNISAYYRRSINDKIMSFERNFLITGLSKKRSARHVIYSTTPYKLKVTRFPGISEAIYFATRGRGDWDEVRKHITLLAWCLDTANRSLDIEVWDS